MNSRVVGQATIACYVRPGYTGASLADQKPAREDGSPGSLRGSEKPPLTPPRWIFRELVSHSNPSQANLR